MENFKKRVDAMVEKYNSKYPGLIVDSMDPHDETVRVKPYGDLDFVFMKRVAEVFGTDLLNIVSDYDGGYSDVTPGAGWYACLEVRWKE